MLYLMLYLMLYAEPGNPSYRTLKKKTKFIKSKFICVGDVLFVFLWVYLFICFGQCLAPVSTPKH